MSNVYTEALNKLIEEFGRLPGVGPKTAERLAFYILKAEPAEAMALANAIGDVKNKNIIIRDDLVDTAGTLCQAAEAVADMGALDIFALCTHAVLSGNSIERINNSAIKRVIISDSINVEEKKLPGKF